MWHREREIVPEGKTNERKGALSLGLVASVRNTEDAIIRRGAASSLRGARFKEVGQVRVKVRCK